MGQENTSHKFILHRTLLVSLKQNVTDAWDELSNETQMHKCILSAKKCFIQYSVSKYKYINGQTGTTFWLLHQRRS